MPMTAAKERLWTLGFVNLLAFDILYQFGAYMTNTVIAVYAVGLGATYGIAGLLAGLNPGTSMAVRPVTGLIADLLSKKTLLISSAVLFLAATIGCAVFDSLLIIGFCRILQGASFALRSVCVVALASKVLPESKLGSGMGWMGLSSVVSTATGPLVSEQVGTVWGYHASFALAAVMLAGCVALALAFRVPASARASRAERPAFSLRQLRSCFHLDTFLYRPNLIFTAMAGLSGVPQGISISLIILAAEQRGIDGATVFFTCYALASLVGRPAVGRLSDKVGTRRIALPLFFVELAAVVVLMLMQSTAMIAVAALRLGVGQGSLYPVLQAESVRGVESAALGRAANTFYIGPDVNMCLSPIIGSLLLGSLGVTAMYGFGAAAVCAAIVLYAVWLRHHPT